MAALCANMVTFNDEPKTSERCCQHIHKVTIEYIGARKSAREFANKKKKKTANVSIPLGHFSTCAS